MDLTRPAGHMFDAVNKTLRLLKSRVIMEGLPEKVVSLEILKYF